MLWFQLRDCVVIEVHAQAWIRHFYFPQFVIEERKAAKFLAELSLPLHSTAQLS